MSKVHNALKKLTDKGANGNFPKGCIHKENKKIELHASDHHHTTKICSSCLEELMKDL